MISDKQNTPKPPPDLRFQKDSKGKILIVILRTRAWDQLLSEIPNPEKFAGKTFQPPSSSAFVHVRIDDWRKIFPSNPAGPPSVSLPKTATPTHPKTVSTPAKAVPTEHFGDGTARTSTKADVWTPSAPPVKRPKGETFKDLPLEGDSQSDCAGDPPPTGSWQDQARKKSSTGKSPKKISKRKASRTKTKRSKKR